MGWFDNGIPLPNNNHIGAGGAALGADAFVMGPSGIAALAAGGGGSILNYFGQQDTNSANAQQAVAQMQFQKMMSDTSYQRGVVDMRKAGINPMLAIMNGGASSASGAMAKMENPAAGITDALSGAMDYYQKAKMNDSNIEINNANKALLLNRATTEASNAREAQENAKQAKMASDRMEASQEAAVKMAPYQPYIDAVGKAMNLSTSALEGVGIWKGLKYLGAGKQLPGTGVMKDGTRFNLNTGEVLK